MKNEVTIEEISNNEWNRPHEETLEILKFWLKTGIKSEIDLISDVDVMILKERMKNSRDKSEAMASHIFSLKNNTKLIYSNEKWSPVNGQSHGIDLGHLSCDDQTLYVIEVKYTEKNTTQNFADAKIELLSRFDPKKPRQLNVLLNSALKNSYIDADKASKIEGKHVEKNLPNMIDFMPLSLIPTALVVSHKKTQPLKDSRLFKVLYILE